MHTENQLPRLPGSALKVPGGGVVGWLPTHFKVSLQLQLRLSWAVTTLLALEDKVKITDGSGDSFKTPGKELPWSFKLLPDRGLFLFLPTVSYSFMYIVIQLVIC